MSRRDDASVDARPAGNIIVACRGYAVHPTSRCDFHPRACRRAGELTMKHQVFLCGLAAMMTISSASVVAEDRIKTATPIKHLVVIFQENVSFDHYFGSYPNAQNNAGETPFAALEHDSKGHQQFAHAARREQWFRPARGRRPDGQKSQRAAWERSRHQRQPTPPTRFVCRPRRRAHRVRITRIWPNSSPTTMEKWTRFRVPPAAGARRRATEKTSSWAITTAIPSRRCGTTRNISR